MARNNFVVTLINEDKPQRASLVAEPVYAFKTSLQEFQIASKSIADDYKDSFVLFTIDSEWDKVSPVIKKESGEVIPTKKAQDPQDPKAGEYTAFYDPIEDDTEFKFYFKNAKEIIDLKEVVLFVPLGDSDFTWYPLNYEEEINQTALPASEKSQLKISISDIFKAQGGLDYAKVYVFNDYAQLKEFQKKIYNVVLVAINFYSPDFKSFYDPSFLTWFQFNGESASDIELLKNNYKNKQGFSNIAMVQRENQPICLITSAYYGRIKNFVATNIQAFDIASLPPILDENAKSLYRENNILFYTKMNEDSKSRECQLKEGNCLDGQKIDLITSLNWLIEEATSRLMREYKANGGDNSKLDANLSTGKKRSVYHQSLEIFFDSMVANRTLLSFSKLRVLIEQTQGLKFRLQVAIVYNPSIPEIFLDITNYEPDSSLLGGN